MISTNSSLVSLDIGIMITSRFASLIGIFAHGDDVFEPHRILDLLKYLHVVGTLMKESILNNPPSLGGGGEGFGGEGVGVGWHVDPPFTILWF